MGHGPYQQGLSGVWLRKIIYAVLQRAREEGYIEGVQCTVFSKWRLPNCQLAKGACDGLKIAEWIYKCLFLNFYEWNLPPTYKKMHLQTHTSCTNA